MILSQYINVGPVENPPAIYIGNTGSGGGGGGGGRAGYTSFGMWNRLEGRPRTRELTRALNAEVNDPLFMLTRQWQFGEYNMDDTGTSTFAKLELETTELSRYQSFTGQVKPFSKEIPLEVTVEKQEVELSYKERLVIGNKLVKSIKDNIASSTVEQDYIDILLSDFTFEIPVITNSNPPTFENDVEVLNKTKLLANNDLLNFLRPIRNRKVDGSKFINELKTFIGPTENTSSTNLNNFANNFNFPAGERSNFVTAVQSFYAWYKKLYCLPIDGENNWDQNKLEYSFKVSTAAYVNNVRQSNAILKSEEYYQGSLDWYNFVRVEGENTEIDKIQNTANTYSNETKLTTTYTVIPNLARFPGMPANRFWEFEDGSVNFGKIDANTADVAKMLLVEFALVHQDDWCLIPYTVPVGSSSHIKGIVVTDVFGYKTFIKHASESESNQNTSVANWEKWNMYNLTSETNSPGRYPADQRILIPPTVIHTLESEDLEKIIFIRDEMSNLVWAIEKTIFDQLGSGVDSYKFENNIREYLKQIRPSEESSPNENEEHILKYKLGNDVSMNWIPFIPVHIQGQNRANILQRASMPLILDNYDTIPVRPNTNLLRHGIAENDILVGADPKYFIFEEEVPRSGIVVKSNLQRTRWFNGKTYLWKGFKKTNGRGEGDSGLEFDRIIE
jgi:hypothetical protein